MAVAPQPYLSACLRVLEYAIIEARSLGWAAGEGTMAKQGVEQVTGLMDAVHNLPHLIEHWERVDQQWLRNDLRHYDERWGHNSHFRLLEAYEHELKRDPVSPS